MGQKNLSFSDEKYDWASSHYDSKYFVNDFSKFEIPEWVIPFGFEKIGVQWIFLVEVLSSIWKESVLYWGFRKIFIIYYRWKIRFNIELFNKIFCEIFFWVYGSNDVLIQNGIATVVIHFSLKSLYLSNCSFKQSQMLNRRLKRNGVILKVPYLREEGKIIGLPVDYVHILIRNDLKRFSTVFLDHLSLWNRILLCLSLDIKYVSNYFGKLLPCSLNVVLNIIDFFVQVS